MDRKRIEIKKEMVDKIFEDATEQSDYIINLMKLAVPRFDALESVDPTDIKITKETSGYICQKCMDWDRINKVESMRGGAWLNYGFSFLNYPNDLPDFVADVPTNYIKEI